MIADALNAASTPDRSVFYTSGRTSNEAAFLYQAFVRFSTVPTTFLIVQTCAMSQAGRAWFRRLV